METSAAQIPQQQRHSDHHRSGERHKSHRKRTKKLLQRIGIVFFLLIVMLAIFYVWVSSGSPEATGQLLQSPSTKVDLISHLVLANEFLSVIGSVSRPLLWLLS